MESIQQSTSDVAVPSVKLSALGLLFAFVCYYYVQTYWKLKHIPGPFWAKFTDWQRALWVKTKRAQEIHLEQHEKHGDVVRFGPNMVSLADPNLIPELYPMRAGFPKSLFYRGIMPYTRGGAFPAVFTTQDENQHRILKNPVANLYSLTNVITFEKFVDDVLEILFTQLDQRFVDTPQIFDLGLWIQYFAFDVMGTMTFSKRYGFLETGADSNGLIGAIWQFMLTIGPMTQIPWFDKIWYKSRVAEILQNQVAVPILKIVSNAIDERQNYDIVAESKKDIRDRDFLSRFLEIQSDNKVIPNWAARTWTFSNVIAGSDSTTVVMRTAAYHILRHKPTLAKLQEELATADKTSGLRRPFPLWNEVKDLPYLDACVWEAVRLHPPFSLALERVVPVGGMTIGDTYFPDGTQVGMNPYVVNRHKPTFGEDVEEWRPERWLVDAAHRRKLEGSIMTFGAGRRTCLGRHIAVLEIKKLIPALLLNYEIEMTNPEAYFVESSYFFRQEGIKVRMRKHIDA